MRLAKVFVGGVTRVAVLEESTARLLPQTPATQHLSDILHAADPLGAVAALLPLAESRPLSELRLLAPIDNQEVWAAGVTYKRSQVARMEESEAGASHYDRVYTAPRPELFFKSTPTRVTGPDEPIRVRGDSQWTVPEPELTLVISPAMKLVGFTVGDDMSARDIEGENPLYLPQAKMYRQCCGLGPCVWIPEEPFDPASLSIELVIERGGETVFLGSTSTAQMARSFENLIDWLGRENEFPTGVFLLTGTGIVPPNEFTLSGGETVSITISHVGTLRQPVVKGP
jgi:2-dehydro-3-deoxy-D-arabinonate dehydratase